MNKRKIGLALGGVLLLAALALLVFPLTDGPPESAAPVAIDPNKPPVTDPSTEPKVPVVPELAESMVPYVYGHDAMDRGGYEYMKQPIVIDQNFKSAPKLKRGDVVAFTTPEKALAQNPYMSRDPRNKQLARVVGLPGETVEIQDVQIYIDGARLDTFYGSFHRRNAEFDEYAASGVFPNGPPQKSDYDRAAVTLSAGQVYVMADDWFRGIDSLSFGPLEEKDLHGKVLGYKN